MTLIAMCPILFETLLRGGDINVPKNHGIDERKSVGKYFIWQATLLVDKSLCTYEHLNSGVTFRRLALLEAKDIWYLWMWQEELSAPATEFDYLGNTEIKEPGSAQ